MSPATARRLARIELLLERQRTRVAHDKFHTPKLDPFQITVAIRLREIGMSFQRIADTFGVANVTVAKWVRRAGRADLCGRIARGPGRRRGPRLKTSCRQCGKGMSLPPALSARTKYCSRACMSAAYRKT